MLTPSGAKVLDFGIAASTGDRDHTDGPVMGTPAYVAPERFDGIPATPATDMYSLGVLLYHCLAGRLPWPANTGTGLLHSNKTVDPAPLPAVEGLAPEVVDLCSRCLDREPRQRPTALVAALLLAESVGAQVYVPIMDPGVSAGPRPSAVSAWDDRAANAVTGVAVPAEPAGRERDTDEDRAGRHRAG
jgi:serine/threonine-protein kinase